MFGANLAQALYNVKIAKTKYVFKGSDCEDVNKGKRLFLKMENIALFIFESQKSSFFLTAGCLNFIL